MQVRAYSAVGSSQTDAHIIGLRVDSRPDHQCVFCDDDDAAK